MTCIFLNSYDFLQFFRKTYFCGKKCSSLLTRWEPREYINPQIIPLPLFLKNDPAVVQYGKMVLPLCEKDFGLYMYVFITIKSPNPSGNIAFWRYPPSSLVYSIFTHYYKYALHTLVIQTQNITDSWHSTPKNFIFSSRGGGVSPAFTPVLYIVYE